MTSCCFVSVADYRLHFDGLEIQQPAPTLWTGNERRATTERRVGHDRRWQTTTGRRFRIGDRRKEPQQ